MAAKLRNWFATSLNFGLSKGSVDQHLSISDFHSESQYSGIGGRNVLLTIPPVNVHVTFIIKYSRFWTVTGNFQHFKKLICERIVNNMVGKRITNDCPIM